MGSINPAGRGAKAVEGLGKLAEVAQEMKNVEKSTEVVGHAAAEGTVAALGTSFGKYGTLVENPGIKVNWSTFAGHGTSRMVERGVTQEMVDEWVAHGKVLEQPGGKYLFVTQEGAAVVRSDGKLITVWSRADFKGDFLALVEQLFGKK